MDNNEQLNPESGIITPSFTTPTKTYPRRTLAQHNPGTSPIKAFGNLSPRVTPTKCANPYGDRYIPLRQPSTEWNSRFSAIHNPEFAEPTFKKPMGNSNRNNVQTPQAASGVEYYISGHSSGTSTPTGYQACYDDVRRDELVVRALLRNEMLKERIDDVKTQLQFLPSDQELAQMAQLPIVITGPGVGTQTPSGILPQLERNAYGGSDESLVVPIGSMGGEESPDPARRNGAQSPTIEAHEQQTTAAAAAVGHHMLNRTRAGGGATMTPAASTNPPPTTHAAHSHHASHQHHHGEGSPNHQAAAASTCGESPRPISIPLSPVTTLNSSPARSLFTYSAKITPNKYGSPSTSINFSASPFSGPLGEDSQRLLRTPRKPQRKVPKNPYKVLDAPELQDDFYLNLVDWSSQNQLAVGLSSCVYLWSATTSQVTKLCDLVTEQDTVTSVQWADKGDLLAVGTNRGITQIWDAQTLKKVRELSGHTSRIGCLAWNSDTICSGSRDRTIMHRDIRCDDGLENVRKLTNHRQEVCGLKWSPDKQLLASGGNDNQLLIWNLRRSEPVQTYTQHNAAVKALAWSPHHHGLLVSGGGTADRCLRFWNTLTAQPMQCIDTGSQVCNVAWSKHSNELVSTHGYSYNHVIIWKYPSLQPVTKLVGHQYRVLYLAMSPDGESIVTGAGDETLRFWHCFNKTGAPRVCRSKLSLLSSLR